MLALALGIYILVDNNVADLEDVSLREIRYQT
jgi:hypothetical protein